MREMLLFALKEILSSFHGFCQKPWVVLGKDLRFQPRVFGRTFAILGEISFSYLESIMESGYNSP
jgi:hypothetical protein